MKRFLSLLLTIAVLLSFVSTAYAAENEDDSEINRYTVIVLDMSNEADFLYNGSIIYTADTASNYVKKAAKKFLTDVVNADGNNYVSVVSYRSEGHLESGFDSDAEALKDTVDSIQTSDNVRDISAGLKIANDILSEIPNGENTRKNVVLFTTGMTNNGSYSYDGFYNSGTVGSNWYRTDTGVKLYAYANNAISEADTLKKQANLYVVGLFQTMDGMPTQGKSIAEFFRLTASDLATSKDHFYSVDDPDKLEFVFGDVAEDITDEDELKQIKFYYTDNDSAICYYTNDYFSDSSYKYNQSLATMSLAFAMSAFGIKDGSAEESVAYQNSSKNAKQLLLDIGMQPDSISTNTWFEVKPTTDSIGVIAGNMPITTDDENYTLIAVAVRGGGYEQEWASNFTIGTTGQHIGFDTAKTNVLNFLKEYIDEKDIKGNVKFWITGYSRAAATANLVAGALDQSLKNNVQIDSDIDYDLSDIYAYCFETPAGAVTSEVRYVPTYQNIYNIINSNDPVPYVAPSVFGFGRYGFDYYLPSQQSDSQYSSKKARMLQYYDSLPNTEKYVVDDFQMKKLNMEVDVDVNWNWFDTSIDSEVTWVHDDTKNNYSQGVYLSNYVTILAKDFLKNRETYSLTYQNEIREICSVVFGCTDQQSKTMMDSIVNQAKNNWGVLAWSYIYQTGVRGLWPWNWGNAAEREDEALKIISNWLINAVKEAGITNYDEYTIDRAGKDIADLSLALISNHPNYFTTALCNGSGIIAAHYPELCFAWMCSMDDNYSDGNVTSLNNGSYRVIHINCPVDVSLYDKDGKIVSAIVNETPEEIEGSSIITSINEDGEKIVVLPIDTSYDIQITGRESGAVNIGINEYCALAGDFTRAVNFFDIPLEEGEMLTGEIPAYSSNEIKNDTPEGSTTQYSIQDSNGIEIKCDSDLSGENATSAYYNVSISSNSDYGYVIGGGLYQYGNFAQCEAIPSDNSSFNGWYDGNKLISSDAIYRFPVKKDVNLIAQFTTNHQGGGSSSSGGSPIRYTLTFQTNGGSTLSNVAKASGTQIDLAAYTPTKDGYTFAGWYSDEALTAPISKVTLSKDCTVYAKWEAETTADPVETDDRNPFTDVTEADYFYQPVLWGAENEIVQGTTATTFGPENVCTRGQMVTFLWRAFGCPEPTITENPFTDVSADAYYYKAVLWAVEKGIAKGVTATTFDPDGIVNRAQAVTFLWRAEGNPVVEGTSFEDVVSGSYYEQAVIWAVKNSITNGTGTGFNPNADCTRGQIITFLHRDLA